MSYLLDTNVISELSRSKPERNVLRWVEGVPEAALHLSVLSLGEIRRGIERLEVGQKRESLRVWLENDLPQRFGGRLLPVSAGVAERWGRLQAEAGRSLPAIGSLLAATALHHGLRVVTRNVADFALPGLEVVNPWGV